jgi:hypothetical protein
MTELTQREEHILLSQNIGSQLAYDNFVSVTISSGSSGRSLSTGQIIGTVGLRYYRSHGLKFNQSEPTCEK